jgi:hypothetical protein
MCGVMFGMNSDTSYKRANILLATFLFLFVFSKYQRIAANHNIALDLEAHDLRRKFEKGTYKPDVREYLIKAVDSANKLRWALLKSFFAVSITLFIALLLVFWQGSLKPSLPLSWKSIIEISAAFFLMWSTLFELGWGLRTYKGQVLHELIHSLIFRVIFITGSFLLMFALLVK